MKRGHRGATKDYSDVFLVAILIGIVVVVLSLVMAIGHPPSQYPEISDGVVRMDQTDVLRGQGHSREDPRVPRN